MALSSLRGLFPLVLIAVLELLAPASARAQGSDDCSTAQFISGTGSFFVDTNGSTGQTSFGSCVIIHHDVWFTWVAPATGPVIVSFCGTGVSVDTVIGVWDAGSCPPSSLHACNDDFCGTQSQVTFSAVSGNQYVIACGAWNSLVTYSGNFTIQMPSVPPEDDCSSPITISGTGLFSFDNSVATTGAQGQSEAACLFFGQTTIANDIWFKWTAPSTPGIATIDTCGQTSVDTKIAIYEGPPCPAAATIACNDDACFSLQSQVQFGYVPNADYTIQLGCYFNAPGGTGWMNITVGPPQVRISQIYGGGGDTAAPVLSDFIELYNPGPASQSLNGWSVQYSAATSTGAWLVTVLPNVTLGAGRYFLVKEADGTTNPAGHSSALPAPDATGTIAMAAGAGKVALVLDTIALTGNPPSTASILDVVGYGATANFREPMFGGVTANNAPAATSNLALYRLDCGTQDTDHNAADFVHGNVSPRNSALAISAGVTALGMCYPQFGEIGQSVRLVVAPFLCGTSAPATATVTANLTAIGGGAAVAMNDAGASGDQVAGDGLYSIDATIGAATTAGSKNLPVSLVSGSSSGATYVVLEVRPSITPNNDNCHTAFVLTGAFPQTSASNLQGCTAEWNVLQGSGSPPVGFQNVPTKRGLWFTLTGTGNTLTVDTCASPLNGAAAIPDTQINVLGGACENLTWVAGNDDTSPLCGVGGGTERRSRVSFCSVAGATYYVLCVPFSVVTITTPVVLTVNDDSIPCGSATPLAQCSAPSPPGAFAEGEADFGVSVDDGCDSLILTPAGASSAHRFVAAAPSPAGEVFTGNARGWASNRDPDWYRFQAGVTGTLQATLTAQFIGIVDVRQLSASGTCSTNTLLAQSTPNARCGTTLASASVTAGNWYAARVLPINAGLGTIFGGVAPGFSAHSYSLTLQLGSPPANDPCASSTLVAVPSTTAGTTALASNDGTSSCDPTGRDVWYRFTLAAPSSVLITVTSGAIDPVVSLHSACGGIELACNDDCGGCHASGTNACLALSGLAAGTYFVRVSDKGLGLGGAFSLGIKGMLNDECCGAVAVAVPSSTPGTTLGAALEAGLPPTCTGPGPGDGGNFTTTAPGVWYQVVSPTTRTVYADTLTASFNTKLTVYTGSCGALTCVTVNDDINGVGANRSKVAWVATAGQTYRILVHGSGAATGTFTLNVVGQTTPPNDSCGTPIPASVFAGSIFGTTAGATGDNSGLSSPGLASCAPAFTYFDVWFRWTAPCTGNVNFDTCGTLDTVLSVHSSCPTFGASNQLAGVCNDNGGAGCTPGSALSFPAVAGTSYFVRVATAGPASTGTGGGGPFTLTWAQTGLPDADGDGLPNCVDFGLPHTNRIDQPPARVPDPYEQPSLFAHSLAMCLVNGEATVTATDMEVPSRGFPMRWARTYSSRALFNAGSGKNWVTDYNRHITPTAGGVTRTDEEGREEFFPDTGGTLQSPPGVFSTITQTAAGYTEEARDGFTYEYDLGGYLTRIEDRSGNQLIIARNALHRITQITDTQSRPYTFTYDANQNLTSITDFSGRQVQYVYDGEQNLVRVRSPVVTASPGGIDTAYPNGKVTLYTYSSGFGDPRLDHNLTSIVEPAYNGNLGDPGIPAGNPTSWKARVTLTYSNSLVVEDPSFDRVVAERWGHDQGGTASSPDAGGSSSYQYSAGIFPGVPGATRRTVEADRNDNLRQHYFDSTGREIRTVAQTNREVRPAEPDYVTSYVWSSDGLLDSVDWPRGNRTTFLYDSANPRRPSKANLLERRQQRGTLPGPVGDLVWRYTYDPVFNQLRSSTDPRAFAQGLVPPGFDPSSAPFTVLRLFDYQEGSGFQANQGVTTGALPEGQGDLNGDFVLNQTRGNVVRTHWPTVTTIDSGVTETIVETRTYDALGKLTAIVDPDGETTSFQYQNEYITGVTRGGPTLALLTRYLRDNRGNCIGIVDPKNQQTDFTVNQLNQVVRVQSRIVSGAIRYEERRRYDANDEVVEVRRSNQDENGAPYAGHPFLTDSYTYDVLHLVRTAVRDRTRNDGTLAGTVSTEYHYDTASNLRAVRLPDTPGQTHVVSMLYDERGLLYKAVRGDDDVDAATEPGLASVTTWNYDPNGNLIEEVDGESDAQHPGPPSTFPGSGEGDVRHWVWDAFDRLVGHVDPEGSVETLELDTAGNVTGSSVVGVIDDSTTTTATLAESDYVYDELSRLITHRAVHVLPGGTIPPSNPDTLSITKWRYDREDRVVRVTDDRNLSTHFAWDDADRLASITDALGNTLSLGYDPNSNRTSSLRADVSSGLGSAPQDFLTTWSYDGLDRCVRRVDPAGSVFDWSYDSRNNVVRTSDSVRGAGHPNGPGNLVLYHHDGLDRLVRTDRVMTSNGRGDGAQVPAALVSSHWSWDDGSRLVLQVDDLGGGTSYAYDVQDRLTRVERCTGPASAWTFAYDRDGQLAAWADPNGTQCLTTYDGRGRLIARIAVLLGAGVVGPTGETFGYDGLARLTRMSHLVGGVPQDTHFRYDSLGNRQLEQRGDLLGLAVVSEHDGAGNRRKITYPLHFGGGTRQLSLAFDAVNRVDTIQDGANPLATFEYKGAERLEQLLFGNGGTLDVTWDAFPRPTRFLSRLGAQTLADAACAYDRMGHRLYDRRADQSVLGNVYAYDSNYRLGTAQRSALLGASPPGYDVPPDTFVGADRLLIAYDGAGSRTSLLASSGGTQSAMVYVADCNGQYTVQRPSLRASGPSVNNPPPPVYDANGNLKEFGPFRYVYDFKNRLAELRSRTSNALLATYAYDAADRRIRKQITNPASTTKYLYDGNRCLEELDAANALLVQYAWDEAEGLLEIAGPTAKRYPVHGPGGTIAKVTSASGAEGETYAYEEFGFTAASPSSAPVNPYRWHGLRQDPESGLYLIGGRSWSPVFGRFLQRDPAGAWSQLANAGGAYTLAGNDPLSTQGLEARWPSARPHRFPDAALRPLLADARKRVTAVRRPLPRGFLPAPDAPRSAVALRELGADLPAVQRTVDQSDDVDWDHRLLPDWSLGHRTIGDELARHAAEAARTHAPAGLGHDLALFEQHRGLAFDPDRGVVRWSSEHVLDHPQRSGRAYLPLPAMEIEPATAWVSQALRLDLVRRGLARREEAREPILPGPGPR